MKPILSPAESAALDREAQARGITASIPNCIVRPFAMGPLILY